MNKRAEKLNIRFRFKDEIREDQEQEMWGQFFDAIGLFKDESRAIELRRHQTSPLDNKERKTNVESK